MGEGGASLRCGIGKRGTCREARFQSRCEGTTSILGDVKNSHGPSLMASPVSLTGGHDLLRKSSHAHITHTLPTGLTTNPWTETKTHQQLQNFLRKLYSNPLVSGSQLLILLWFLNLIFLWSSYGERRRKRSWELESNSNDILWVTGLQSSWIISIPVLVISMSTNSFWI